VAIHQIEFELRDIGRVGRDLGFILLDQELTVGHGLLGDRHLRAQLLVARQVGAGLV